MDRQLSRAEKVTAAMTGAVVSAAFVTPLDVIKTRLQVEHHEHMRPRDVSLIVRHVVQEQGVRGLWRGLNLAFVNSVPTVGVYLLIYDTLQPIYSRSVGPWDLSLVAPALAGVSARSVAVLLSSPIERLRTRLQSGRFTQHQHTHRLSNFFSGFWPYFIRDVPFSAIYWFFLEHSRNFLIPGGNYRSEEHSSMALLGANMTSGLLSGSIAAFITHPWDVIYVNAVSVRHPEGQPEQPSASLKDSLQVARGLYQRGGLSIFFAGAVPRLVKVAASCAIVITTYELAKWFLLLNDRSHQQDEQKAVSQISK